MDVAALDYEALPNMDDGKLAPIMSAFDWIVRTSISRAVFALVPRHVS